MLLSYLLKTKHRELVNLLFAETVLEAHKGIKASDIIIQVVKDGLIAKFDKEQLSELVALVSKGGYRTSLSGEIEKRAARELKEKMKFSEDQAARVAAHGVSFLVNALGSFMQARNKTNPTGIQELMAGETQASLKSKFLSRFKRK